MTPEDAARFRATEEARARRAAEPEAAIRVETPDGRPVYEYLVDRPATVVLRTPTGVLRLRLGPSGWVLLDTPDGALRFQPEASNAAYVAVDKW